MDDRFRGLMLDAARLTRAGRLHEATRAIRSALGDTLRADAPAPGHGDVLDGLVTEVGPAGPRDACRIEPPAGLRSPRPAPAPHDAPDDRLRGGVHRGTHAHGSMSRDYRLFVPPDAAGRALPLVVMLHGCTQDPEDFAAGTRMDVHARAQGVVVLYPAQSRRANPQGCWNWFKHTHQRRDRGEPGLIASMAQDVVRRYGLDPDRVYVAGLSAGGAMAALVAACHPEVFAAVGVHSGLAPGAAASLPEAMAAMRGAAGPHAPGIDAARGGHPVIDIGAAAARPAPLDVPAIVFHGDHDRTVHPCNGEQVIDAVIGTPSGRAPTQVEHGESGGGRRFTRRVHGARDGRPDAEHWIVHGAGHGWAGGSPAGTYTDPGGPDASAEMLRFFLERRRPVRE